MIDARNWINGAWRESLQQSHTVDPYTLEPVSNVHWATLADVEMAVSAARQGAEAMEAWPLHRRAFLLRRVAARLIQEIDVFAQAIVAEAGKPITMARREVERASETLQFAADAAMSLAGHAIPMDASVRGEGRLAFTVRVPVGVVAAITPYNSPLNLACHKLGPAFAAGNAVVLKPAPQTPWCILRLVELFLEEGLPPHAIQLLFGDAEVGQAIVSHPDVDMVSFTGGGAAGKRVTQLVGIKKLLMELGGNGGVIVHKDADLQRAAAEVAANGFGYSGQSCIGVQRVYVHDAVWDSFVEQFLAETRRVKVGDPREPDTVLGPMISEEEAERVAAWVQEALDAGARLLYGGQRKGRLMYPTVLVDVNPRMKVVCEEVWGPVVSLIPYKSLDEAIAAMNESQYGLQAGIFTRSLSAALQAIKSLKTGGVVINGTSNYRVDQMPYGGVKSSGIGREGPRYAVEAMSHERLVIVNP